MTLLSLPGLKAMVGEISEQKKLPTSVVEAALGEALLKGYEKFRRNQRLGEYVFEEDYFANFEVELDLDEEGFRVLASKAIVETIENSDHQIALQEVQTVAPEAQLGDTVVLDVTPDKEEFGRMAAIQTKQVLAQKLRDHQRKMIQEEFQDLDDNDRVLNAKVLRFERQSIILEVSSGPGRAAVEAELPRREQLPNDNYRANSTFRVYLKEVSEAPRRGSQLIVSRANAALVVYLFENEVPEIQDGTVRIVAVAREAVPPSRHVGPRTKIAVDTLERDVDPVGACIGARGSRIQVVVNELRGEKIDVIRWSPDPATYISNALSPAKVEQLYLVDPEERQAHVLVAEDQLSLAIGKDGQNVRLAAKLTGWKIDIKDTAKYSTEDSSPAMQRQRSQPSKRLSEDLPASEEMEPEDLEPEIEPEAIQPEEIEPEEDKSGDETIASEAEIQSEIQAESRSLEFEIGAEVGAEPPSEMEAEPEIASSELN